MTFSREYGRATGVWALVLCLTFWASSAMADPTELPPSASDIMDSLIAHVTTGEPGDSDTEHLVFDESEVTEVQSSNTDPGEEGVVLTASEAQEEPLAEVATIPAPTEEGLVPTAVEPLIECVDQVGELVELVLGRVEPIGDLVELTGQSLDGLDTYERHVDSDRNTVD